jgi:hypothetical protein
MAWRSVEARELLQHGAQASALADGGAGDEAQRDHDSVHDHHDAAGALGADKRRSVQELGLVQHADELGRPNETTAWVIGL